MFKAAIIAEVTNLFTEVRAVAVAALNALPAAQAQAISDAQAAVTKAQNDLAALSVSQAADLQAANAKVATIDASQADVITELTKGLPDDPVAAEPATATV